MEFSMGTAGMSSVFMLENQSDDISPWFADGRISKPVLAE